MILLVLLAVSCKKADKAYDKLLDIPELELSSGFVYKGAYLVGDTMVIYGRLNPSKSNFKRKNRQRCCADAGVEEYPERFAGRGRRHFCAWPRRGEA